MDRLVVIDDEPELARFVGRVGESMGFDVKVTARVGEFKDIIDQWRPCIIILDLAMPEEDGLELLRWLASVNCQAQIVIMSGFDTRIVEAAKCIGLERGLKIACTFNKPIRVQDLKEKLEAIRKLNPEIPAFNEDELRSGIIQSQFSLVYQPQVLLKNGALQGAEAMIRWDHPVHGVMSSEQVLHTAEGTDLYEKLSTFIITNAIRQWKLWSQRGLDIQLGVNLSLTDLRDQDLADQIARVCEEEAVPPQRITIEVAEAAIMSNALDIFDVTARLRLKGFKLSIDGFGTGYSSLTRLQRLPVTELKIDKALVNEAQLSQDSLVIVKAIIGLARNLGLTSVAEGIDTVEHYELLASLGCDLGQGFGIAKPVAPDELLTWSSWWFGPAATGKTS
jgi:EAL domain-containing protein (putative c-di-GMP-specific phosphodiesterase class I)/CheY-like chemotaxis protein